MTVKGRIHVGAMLTALASGALGSFCLLLWPDPKTEIVPPALIWTSGVLAILTAAATIVLFATMPKKLWPYFWREVRRTFWLR